MRTILVPHKNPRRQPLASLRGFWGDLKIFSNGLGDRQRLRLPIPQNRRGPLAGGSFSSHPLDLWSRGRSPLWGGPWKKIFRLQNM